MISQAVGRCASGSRKRQDDDYRNDGCVDEFLCSRSPRRCCVRKHGQMFDGYLPHSDKSARAMTMRWISEVPSKIV